jgi:hypothetical protein
MKKLIPIIAILALAVPLTASGPLGIYGIVERVVFEPNEQAPERLQLWGAFAYADGAGDQALSVSAVKRGYIYFRLSTSDVAAQLEIDLIRREWNDLKSVAGTGQAVGFGRWGYIGGFGGLEPDRSSSNVPYILEKTSSRSASITDLRVRPASEAPINPAQYQTNTGVVKLSETGNHADVVKQLRAAIPR